jgi:SAM-dependent methyltransferase
MSFACPLCARATLERLDLDLPFFRHVDFSTISRRGTIFLCNACGVIISKEFFSKEIQVFTNPVYLATKQTDKIAGKSSSGGIKTRVDYQIELLCKLITAEAPSILDIGCFDGRLLDGFSKAKRCGELVGYDICFEKCAASLLESSVRLTNDLPGALNQRYDLVIFSHSISYIEDLPILFEQIQACLKPNGKIFVQMPNIDVNPLYALMGDQIYTFTPTALLSILRRYDFLGHLVGSASFPREAMIIACARKTTSSLDVLQSKYPSLVELYSKLIAKKQLAESIELVGPTAVFGTTVNAAFVDEVVKNRISCFADENIKAKQFRRKSVVEACSLTEQHNVLFPYDQALLQKVRGRATCRFTMI